MSRVVLFSRCCGRALLAPRRVGNFTATRFFSGKDDDEDPFGLKFEEGDELGKLGADIPPRYVRDATTGKFTGEKIQELSSEEKSVINMDEEEEERYLLDKMTEQWNLNDDDDDSDLEVITKDMRRQALLARRIREDNMGLNVLGRSNAALSVKGQTEEGEETYQDTSEFSKPLSPSEFNVFKKHMKEEYDELIEDGAMPVEETDGVLDGFADNEYLNRKWLSSTAVRFMDDSKDDDPFSDLMPMDLNPTMYVNRKKAKPIPRKLLHQNNIKLLRRFTTPSGLIMNRMHSRLGAKDQRKIAKLVKRARQLGFIPFQGQFDVEDHGDIHEKDLHEDKEWEKELVRRGLVIKSTVSADKNYMDWFLAKD